MSKPIPKRLSSTHTISRYEVETLMMGMKRPMEEVLAPYLENIKDQALHNMVNTADLLNAVTFDTTYNTDGSITVTAALNILI